MPNLDEKQYTVTDSDRVKDALGLESSPVFINVESVRTGREDVEKGACKVTLVPPEKHQRVLSVSNSLLQDLLKEGAIKGK